MCTFLYNPFLLTKLCIFMQTKSRMQWEEYCKSNPEQSFNNNVDEMYWFKTCTYWKDEERYECAMRHEKMKNSEIDISKTKTVSKLMQTHLQPGVIEEQKVKN